MENTRLSRRDGTSTADKKQIPLQAITRNPLHCSTSVPPNQFEASTETAEHILNGTCSNEELDAITKMLLEHMKKVSKLVITSTITAAKFQSKILLWEERTSTSPSGVHLEHYKSCYATHTHEKSTTEYKEFEQR
jgi:hypothetical protein